MRIDKARQISLSETTDGEKVRVHVPRSKMDRMNFKMTRMIRGWKEWVSAYQVD